MHLCWRLASRVATPPSVHLSCRSCIATALYGLPRLYRNIPLLTATLLDTPVHGCLSLQLLCCDSQVPAFSLRYTALLPATYVASQAGTCQIQSGSPQATPNCDTMKISRFCTWLGPCQNLLPQCSISISALSRGNTVFCQMYQGARWMPCGTMDLGSTDSLKLRCAMPYSFHSTATSVG